MGQDDSAPTVVLVHGFVASSRYFVPTIHALAPHCRALAPDLPGWGASSKPATALSVPALADVLAAWEDAMGLRAPIVLANSLGCQIAAELAVRHPDHVAALILLGPTVDPEARSARRQGLRLLLDVPLERPSLWAVELADFLRMGPRIAAGTVRAMLDHRIETILPQIDAPVLVMRGEFDPIAPRRWAEEVAALAQHGRFIELRGAGHAAHYSAADRMAEAALPFIRDVQALAHLSR
jgi:pimeloyl-ACP methyl ester carboxylesterase